MADQFDEPPADEWLYPNDPNKYPEELYIRAGGSADGTAEALIEQFEDQGSAAAIHHFDSPADLRALLSPGRVALMRELQQEGADSITELAERVGRKSTQVSNDLSVLEDAGIVHFRDGKGRAKAPFIPYEHVHIEAEITVVGEE